MNDRDSRLFFRLDLGCVARGASPSEGRGFCLSNALIVRWRLCLKFKTAYEWFPRYPSQFRSESFHSCWQSSIRGISRGPPLSGRTASTAEIPNTLTFFHLQSPNYRWIGVHYRPIASSRSCSLCGVGSLSHSHSTNLWNLCEIRGCIGSSRSTIPGLLYFIVFCLIGNREERPSSNCRGCSHPLLSAACFRMSRSGTGASGQLEKNDTV